MNLQTDLPHNRAICYAFVTQKKHLAFPKIDFEDVPYNMDPIKMNHTANSDIS